MQVDTYIHTNSQVLKSKIWGLFNAKFPISSTGNPVFLKKKEKSLYRHQQMYTFVSKNANFYTEKHVTI